MRTLGSWVLGSVLLSTGCGAAQAVSDESVVLRAHPPVGARYEVLMALDGHLGTRDLGVHTEARGTLEVRAADETGITLRSSTEHSEMQVLGTPVRLPPLITTEPCEVELHVDGRGALTRAPEAISGHCPALELAAGWIVAVLPDRSVRVGDTWETPPAFVVHDTRAYEAAREGSVVLRAAENGEAELGWETTLHLGPIEHGGGTLSVDHHTTGTTTVALADGISRRGESHTTATFVPTEAVHGWPDRLDLSWCIRGEGEPACELAPPAPDERPSARAYEGEACTSRLALLEGSLAALPLESEYAASEEVPHVEASAGVVPIAGLAPRLVIDGEGIRLDGRTVTVEEVGRDLATLERNWGILHPRMAYPARVHLLAAPTTPLASVEPVLALLAPTTNVDVIVATGPAPALPALPEWMGALPSDLEGRAAALSRGWGSAIAGCPGGIALFGGLANADPMSALSLLREGLPAALATCHCGGADIDAVEALTAHTLSRNEVVLGALVIPAGPGGATLRLRRAGTVADLVTALAARSVPSAPVRLQFR